MINKETEAYFLDTLESNKDKLFRICRSYSSSQEEASDLFQEMLLNVWKSLPSFKGESALGTWMYCITLNVCLRTKQKLERTNKLRIRLSSISLANLPESDMTREDELQYQKLRNCIDKLEGIDKSIILLYLEDLVYKEIGNVLGISENHVAVKMKRIKNKLLTCINLQP
jgi:RNA polymerase sigma factor (sigma-70 family)